MRLRRLTPLLLAAAFAICESHDLSDRVIDIAGVDTLSPADELVIEKRLTVDDCSAATCSRPKMSFTRRDGHVQIRTNSAPISDTDTSFLLTHQGRFRVVNEASETLVDQAGIADAHTVGKEGTAVLALTLTDSAAKRLAALTTATAYGERLRVELDSDTLSTPTLTGPLSTSFQVSMSRPLDQIKLIARILRSGELSFQPKDVTVQVVSGS